MCLLTVDTTDVVALEFHRYFGRSTWKTLVRALSQYRRRGDFGTITIGPSLRGPLTPLPEMPMGGPTTLLSNPTGGELTPSSYSENSDLL